MGHTYVSVTLNTYTSVFDKFKEKEIDKVNRYYLEENMLNAVKMLKEQTIKKNEDDEKKLFSSRIGSSFALPTTFF